MRLLVTGSRMGHPDTWLALDSWLAFNGKPELVILGDARGVDAQAARWALARGLKTVVCRARWATLGLSAGHVRNLAMVALCQPGDHCLAFPRANSRGTLNCMAQARSAGLVVHVIRDAG